MATPIVALGTAACVPELELELPQVFASHETAILAILAPSDPPRVQAKSTDGWRSKPFTLSAFGGPSQLCFFLFDETLADLDIAAPGTLPENPRGVHALAAADAIRCRTLDDDAPAAAWEAVSPTDRLRLGKLLDFHFGRESLPCVTFGASVAIPLGGPVPSERTGLFVEHPHRDSVLALVDDVVLRIFVSTSTVEPQPWLSVLAPEAGYRADSILWLLAHDSDAIRLMKVDLESETASVVVSAPLSTLKLEPDDFVTDMDGAPDPSDPEVFAVTLRGALLWRSPSGQLIRLGMDAGRQGPTHKRRIAWIAPGRAVVTSNRGESNARAGSLYRLVEPGRAPVVRELATPGDTDISALQFVRGRGLYLMVDRAFHGRDLYLAKTATTAVGDWTHVANYPTPSLATDLFVNERTAAWVGDSGFSNIVRLDARGLAVPGCEIPISPQVVNLDVLYRVAVLGDDAFLTIGSSASAYYVRWTSSPTKAGAR